jgi:hypothetical protein
MGGPREGKEEREGGRERRERLIKTRKRKHLLAFSVDVVFLGLNASFFFHHLNERSRIMKKNLK